MKRILLLIKGLRPGGAERLLVSTARYLDRSKFQLEVAYLLADAEDLRPALEASGVRVHCLRGDRSARWLGRLRRLVRECQIDLVHAHSPYVAVGARLALRATPVRLVYTEHGLAASYRRATSWANLLTLPANDHVFAVSSSVRESMRPRRMLRWLPAPEVETLYHGIDPAEVADWSRENGTHDLLGLPDDAPVVGTVANFTRDKGHEHLIAAAPAVRRVFPDVRFVLVGRGPLEAALNRRVRELGLAESVLLVGFREDAPRLVTGFDVFVLPSIREGFSVALIEAMALGKPVVVTRAGGPAEIVEDGRHGYVVPPGDADSIADRVLELLTDAPKRERFGAAARERASDFDVRKAVRRTEEVYEELLQ